MAGFLACQKAGLHVCIYFFDTAKKLNAPQFFELPSYGYF